MWGGYLLDSTRPYSGYERALAVGVLSDTQIRERVRIEPFSDSQKRPGRISFRCLLIWVRRPRRHPLQDLHPHAAVRGHRRRRPQEVQRRHDGRGRCRPQARRASSTSSSRPTRSRSARRSSTIEIPRDVLVICVGKSTYARCGLIVNVTPLEPEWRGKVTLEISNTTPLPAGSTRTRAWRSWSSSRRTRCATQSYADKGGKYQDQGGLTLPKVD
jgi:dCTP deaminase